MTDEAVVNKARPRSEFTEVGRTGLVRDGSSGVISEEFLGSLKGKKAVKAFTEMRDNDPVIGAVLFALNNLVKQARWSVEPFDDSGSAQSDADFLEENMHDMDISWSELIGEIMSMTVFGWSFFEPVYKVRSGHNTVPRKSSKFSDGRVGWAKMGIRSQDSLESWEFNENGEVTALNQRPAPDYQLRTIPMSRGVLFRTSSWKSNPEGRSILRNAYTTHYFKKRMQEVEGIGIERDLNGIPVIYVPPAVLRKNATADEKQTLLMVEKLVKNIRNDSQAGVVLPALYDEKGNQLFKLELLTTLGRRSFDLNATIMRMNKIMATSMLADFVLIGQESVGSFAMASSKTKMFSVAIGSYMDEIADQVNRVLVPRLFAFNGKSPDKLPVVSHGDIETIDLDEMSKFINALSGAGLDLTPEPVREHLAAQMGLPAGSVGVREVENQPFFDSGAGVTPDGMSKRPDEDDDDDD